MRRLSSPAQSTPEQAEVSAKRRSLVESIETSLCAGLSVEAPATSHYRFLHGIHAAGHARIAAARSLRQANHWLRCVR